MAILSYILFDQVTTHWLYFFFTVRHFAITCWMLRIRLPLSEKNHMCYEIYWPCFSFQHLFEIAKQFFEFGLCIWEETCNNSACAYHTWRIVASIIWKSWNVHSSIYFFLLTHFQVHHPKTMCCAFKVYCFLKTSPLAS